MRAAHLLLPFLPLTAVCSQDPSSRNPVAARFQLGGAEATIARDDLALELAARFGRTERGREALQHLIDFELVRREATPAKLMPTQAEIDAQIDGIAKELAKQKLTLAAFLKQRGMTREDFAEYAAISLAHERLVGKALGTAKGERPTNALLELWLKETRDRVGIVDDASKLPAGVLARIGKGADVRDLTALEVGRVLLRTATAEERERYLRQIVVCRILEARAAQSGIAVTRAELAAEVESRRKEVESRGGQAVSFDQLLATQGTTPELLERSPVLRAQVLERRLVERLHPDEDLRASLQKDRASIEKRHGARRRLGVIWLRATDKPNDLVPRTFVVAMQRAEEIRAEIAKGKPFDLAAAVYSEDSGTKTKGGDAGWHHAEEPDFPAEALVAAFATAKGEIAKPVQTKDGVLLVRVTDVEAPPSDAQMLGRLRAELADAFRESLLTEAKVQIVDA